MLNQRLSAYLNYFESLAMQPSNRWDGFYITKHENKNFALRYQIAFSCYALGVLCIHPDAETREKQRCLASMVALIERMLQRRVWAYWSIEAERQGLNTNPVEKANVEYSGHLAMMIGIFETAGGDSRYDEPFTLLWTSSEQFTSNHNSLVYSIWQQMYENHHHGVDSEPGRTYTIHMNQVLWANILHDCLHGSQFRDVNKAWIEFLQHRMVLHGPRLQGRGVFSSIYMSRTRLPVSLGFNLVDAWTLAMISVLEPELTHQLLPRFMKSVRRSRKSSGTYVPPDDRTLLSDMRSQLGEAWIPSATMLRSMEVSDLALTTGFGCILATHIDHTALVAEFLNYADIHLQPVERENKRYYNGGLATPFTTALFAIGEAGGFKTLRDIAYGHRMVQVIPLEPQEQDKLCAETEENI